MKAGLNDHKKNDWLDAMQSISHVRNQYAGASLKCQRLMRGGGGRGKMSTAVYV